MFFFKVPFGDLGALMNKPFSIYHNTRKVDFIGAQVAGQTTSPLDVFERERQSPANPFDAGRCVRRAAVFGQGARKRAVEWFKGIPVISTAHVTVT